MASQPSFKPLDACEFFPDGRSARPLVPGTVPRGYLMEDTALWTGRRVAHSQEQDPATGLTPANLKATVQPKVPVPFDAKRDYADFVDEFPLPVTEQIVQHGYQRFMIYCVVCHDPLGTGQGKIVQRGYTRPPSYHIERLRKAPVGHIFAVISEGYGSMPSYAAQIPVRDRWAIVAYIRALQLSQHTPATQAPQAAKSSPPPVTPTKVETGQEPPRTNRSPISQPKPKDEPRESAP
jgi:mono/diheme cytochrome c family protein